MSDKVKRVLRRDDGDVAVVGANEAARVLGISRQRLHQLLDQRADFPRPETREPDALWDRRKVADWASKGDRGPGHRLPESHRAVRDELPHIPRGGRVAPQNELRDAYVIMRLREWKSGGTASEALHHALDLTRKDHPGYAFTYDETWFRSPAANVEATH